MDAKGRALIRLTIRKRVPAVMAEAAAILVVKHLLAHVGVLIPDVIYLFAFIATYFSVDKLIMKDLKIPSSDE